MDLNRTPARIADAAAEEIRALNHRTLDPKASLPTPPDVAGVAEGINALLQRLPQALEQAGRALEGMADRNEIRMDNGADPARAAAEAGAALLEVRDHLQAAGSAMQDAVNQLARMGGHWPDDEAV